MAGKVGGLGRGLDALLGGASSSLHNGNSIGEKDAGNTAGNGENVLLIDPKHLDANPDQPRAAFDKEALEELAASIKEHGVLQPIIAEETSSGRYRIVAGERRTRAAIIAGLDKVPVIVRGYDENKRLEVALIENIQRTDLNPIEEAAAYERLMAMAGIGQEELSHKVGKKRSTVANALRLLNLSDEIKSALRDGVISAGHARAILAVESDEARTALFHRIVDEGMSVRAAEAAGKDAARSADASSNKKDRKTGRKDKGRDPDIAAIEQQMLEKNGTKCRINGSLQKGKIEIEYYTREELDRLCAMLT